MGGADVPLDVEPTDDGLGYFVGLTLDGITARAFVSSMHLVEDKHRQLAAAIQRNAEAAFSSTHPD
jgi:hypothetical protein